MGIQDFQKYLETFALGACVPVDLLKIAKSVGLRRTGSRVGVTNRHAPYAPGPLMLVLDGECCLDRLYGGFFSDWVCGGQWNRVLQFLAILMQTVQSNNIQLAVMFNGALETTRMKEWVKQECEMQHNVNSVIKHVNMKGTPPPKVWWIPPAALRTTLRLALHQLNIPVYCSIEDHHLEVITFCRENFYHGLMAEDSEYIVFNPPRYFSSHQLKLTYKGSLETKEFILDEISRSVCLNHNQFCLLATLMGNFLMPEEDLQEFYGSILNGYNKQQTQLEDLVQALVKFLQNIEDPSNLSEISERVFASKKDFRSDKLKLSVQYYLKGAMENFSPNTVNPVSGKRDVGSPQTISTSAQAVNGKFDSRLSESLPFLPATLPELLRTAAVRHKRGAMNPWLYQVLSQGEIKIGVCLEDENCRDLPSAALFFRPVRQNVYAIVYNLYHCTYMARKAHEEGKTKQEVPMIKVREWIYSKNNPYRRPDIVEATHINWAVPTLRRLWFGEGTDDKKRRLRAFLTCMNSDENILLDSNYVPQHLLIMATVLRYMLSSGVAVLRKQELDAFLVSAFSAELSDPNYLQDLQLSTVSVRGAQLASLFMMGVETALFANEACGAPVPLTVCCPWLFFDGKLFHAKLMRANSARSLVEVCDGDIDLVAKVEGCRQAILEGLPHILFATNLPVQPMVGSCNRMGHVATLYPPASTASGYNTGQRGVNGHVYSRGGQLQVAGVVVGSWGPNYGGNGGTATHRAVRAGERCFQQRNEFPDPSYPAARGEMGRSRGNSNMIRARPAVLAKRRFVKHTKPPRGRGTTVDLPDHGQVSTMIGHPALSPSNRMNAPFSSQSHRSCSSNGLKSPDSGVNLSILE